MVLCCTCAEHRGSVRMASNSKKKPPTSIIPRDDARRWREGVSTQRDAGINVAPERASYIKSRIVAEHDLSLRELLAALRGDDRAHGLGLAHDGHHVDVPISRTPTIPEDRQGLPVALDLGDARVVVAGFDRDVAEGELELVRQRGVLLVRWL